MRRLKILFHLAGGAVSLAQSIAVSVALALALGLLFWLQTEDSLEQGLRIAAAVLPADQHLQAQGVTGSLLSGGHMDHLVWQKGALMVEGSGVTIRWDWHAVLEGELRVTGLQARTLRLSDRSPASDSPFSELPLPMRADVQFSVDRFEWAGPPAWTRACMAITDMTARRIRFGTPLCALQMEITTCKLNCRRLSPCH